jgi:hypothetical protein
LQEHLRKSQSSELSGCCVGLFDFAQSYGMQHEFQNPLSEVKLGIFPENLSELSEEHSKGFHQTL